MDDNKSVEKVVRVFTSFEEADAADARADAAMTPEERVNHLIELRHRRYPEAAQQGMERVVQIRKLGDDPRA